MPKKSPNPQPPACVAELDTHSWKVFDLAFSPDSKTLVAAMRENVGASLIEVGTWRVRTLPQVDMVPTAIAFAPDSSSFVIAMTKDSPLQCWQISTGTLKWSIKPGAMGAALSPDGMVLAATRAKSVLLCDAASGQILHDLPGHKSRVDHVAFSPDGCRLVSVAQSQVYLWDSRSGQLVAAVQEKQGEVHGLGFSPDNRFLAVANAKGVVRLFDAHSGKPHHQWQAHGCYIWDLVFTADSRRMITISGVGDDESIAIWEFPLCRELHRIQLPDETSSDQLAISPDQNMLAVPLECPEHAVRFWNIETGKPAGQLQFTSFVAGGPPKLRASPRRVAFSPDGNWLAVASDDGKSRIWRAKDVC